MGKRIISLMIGKIFFLTDNEYELLDQEEVEKYVKEIKENEENKNN